MGRKASDGLLFHKGSGQFYKTIDGRRVYFGPGTGPDDQEGLKRATERWVRYVLPPLDTITPFEALKPECKPKPGIVTVKMIRDLYYNEIQDKPRHAKDVKRVLAKWLKWIGANTPISRLTPDKFNSWRKDQLELLSKRKEWEEHQPKPIPLTVLRDAPGISPSEYNKRMSYVKTAFNKAAELKGYTLPEHMRCLKQLKQTTANKREVTLFAASDLSLMLNSPDVFDLKWKAMIVLGLNIAGSNTDVALATWNHIRFDKDVIEYPRRKNHHVRRFPLWKATRTLLLEWQKITRSQSYLFTTSSGRPYVAISPKGNVKDSLGQQFGDKMALLGLPQTWNAIRKTTASLAAEAGANELTIKMILGDAPNEVWRSYAQAMPSTIQTALKAVAEKLGLEA